MARKALIRDADGLVINIIVVGEVIPFFPGHSLQDAGDASIGDTWDGVAFIKPIPTPNLRAAAQTRYLAAVHTNKDASPWGRILYDWAIADGHIER